MRRLGAGVASKRVRGAPQGRDRRARGVNPGTSGRDDQDPASEPRGGDIPRDDRRSDVAPAGLAGTVMCRGSASFPGLAPWALRSRPFKAKETFPYTLSISSGGHRAK
jgi:hypothetical protein